MDDAGTVLLVAYFFPTIVAFIRGHQDKFAILVLNIFLGWTVIGWIKALIWASTATTKAWTGDTERALREIAKTIRDK
jgi:uncharacterized membrane protein YqaE (UPF0057 family)